VREDAFGVVVAFLGARGGGEDGDAEGSGVGGEVGRAVEDGETAQGVCLGGGQEEEEEEEEQGEGLGGRECGFRFGWGLDMLETLPTGNGGWSAVKGSDIAL